MRLSVLDQSVISSGSTAHTALKNTAALAQITEELGFERFWVAEHHNANGIAGTSPEVLISHIAAKTKRIKVGSGGVLLPQYSPYKVAENFMVLEALYPNRIDLGIGRSPGGSPETRLALTDGIRKSLNEFPRQVQDLQKFIVGNQQDKHTVTAYPVHESFPEMWMLGVSHRGARLAAELGLAFTFGHFIAPLNGRRAMDYYYKYFQPSVHASKPKANICTFVICADTTEKAEQMAASLDLWLLALGKGEANAEILSPEQVNRKVLSPDDKKAIKENRRRMIIGTKETVRSELLRLSELYNTEEFMVLTNVYEFEDKVRSYELLAEIDF
ncbi:LLM class flavin-dependent oxidoreductase [Bacillus sp. Au-Bac7]|uniref:LLM class flavin-dependent oxidoreductase n=1 Tax=Bacillus sp. Au-Bac7 TaxID=2906458 RepID=UPI001E61399A|nr:LLM class flavin-dependent oxidoreductase [Bacillus sp. Au-Bac7]MCE4050324.1 LLM class flavin-dependent oxidoreductase [Bacillus sp. Au-Bac7]